MGRVSLEITIKRTNDERSVDECIKNAGKACSFGEGVPDAKNVGAKDDNNDRDEKNEAE